MKVSCRSILPLSFILDHLWVDSASSSLSLSLFFCSSYSLESLQSPGSHTGLCTPNKFHHYIANRRKLFHHFFLQDTTLVPPYSLFSWRSLKSNLLKRCWRLARLKQTNWQSPFTTSESGGPPTPIPLSTWRQLDMNLMESTKWGQLRWAIWRRDQVCSSQNVNME